ncbi:MAG: hypothetical protein AB7S36_18240 [Planctomycetota bacterium]
MQGHSLVGWQHAERLLEFFVTGPRSGSASALLLMAVATVGGLVNAHSVLPHPWRMGAVWWLVALAACGGLAAILVLLVLIWWADRRPGCRMVSPDPWPPLPEPVARWVSVVCGAVAAALCVVLTFNAGVQYEGVAEVVARTSIVLPAVAVLSLVGTRMALVAHRRYPTRRRREQQPLAMPVEADIGVALRQAASPGSDVMEPVPKEADHERPHHR